MNPTVALLTTLLLLLAVFPYVRRAKHPETRLLAAYLVFVTVFAIVAGFLYLALGAVIAAGDLGSALDHPLAAILFVVAILAPAWLLARWQIKRSTGPRSLPR